jgi:fucose 4-O-acetylase-like acetyltransferase
VGISGWRARTSTDEDVATKSRNDHRKVAPLMFLFLALGYTGGLLSLVMQKQPILESPHFWTGSVVLILLATNGVLSAGFGNDKGTLRTVHAYLGSVALVLLFIHAALGLKLGLSI